VALKNVALRLPKSREIANFGINLPPRKNPGGPYRRFKRTFADADYQMWFAKLKNIRALYEEKNSTFWQKEIADCNGNTRRLWQTLQGVLSDPVCVCVLTPATTLQMISPHPSRTRSTQSVRPLCQHHRTTSHIGRHRPWTSGRQ